LRHALGAISAANLPGAVGDRLVGGQLDQGTGERGELDGHDGGPVLEVGLEVQLPLAFWQTWHSE